MAQKKKKAPGTDPDDSFPGLKLKNQLCFSLYSASRLMIQRYRPLLDPLNLTYLQYLTMLILWEQDSLGVSEIGESLGLDSGTLSPLLKKLEQKGLILRERQLEDERSVHICLTDEGQALKAKGKKVAEAIACLPITLKRTDVMKLKAELDILSRDLEEK